MEPENVNHQEAHPYKSKLDTQDTFDNKLPLRNMLNILFILLAIVTVTLYFVLPMPEGQIYFFITGVVAVVIKMVEVGIRQSIQKKRRK
ncbi:MAG: hypothetical protein RR386_06170 [Bacteroidaceae bacterium]